MNNRKYKLIGNYNTNLLNLNISLIKNNLINEQQQINLNNVNDFYQTLILYFKNIDIIANLSINGQYFNIPIWTNNHFYNFLNDVKITNTNLLNISFESITIKDISPENSIITSNDIVIDADTAQGALDAYRIELVTKGSNNENTDKANLKTMQGKVARVSVVAGEAQTVVSFLLEDEKTIFSVTTNNSPLALFLKEGDQVTFKAVVTENAKAANVEELKIAGLN